MKVVRCKEGHFVTSENYGINDCLYGYSPHVLRAYIVGKTWDLVLCWRSSTDLLFLTLDGKLVQNATSQALDALDAPYSV